MRVTIFDYGAGNLHSLAKALEDSGMRVAIEADPARAIEGDVLVLPGVGAFGAAIGRLGDGRVAMREAILGGLPTLGICLGMQLLFDRSEEDAGAARGLGIIAGAVTRLRAARVPQIGWNDIEATGEESAFRGSPLHVAYYANSYVCRPADERTVIAWSEYDGDRFPAAVQAGNALGVQFHPEKSSRIGVEFLRAWLRSHARTGGAA